MNEIFSILIICYIIGYYCFISILANETSNLTFNLNKIYTIIVIILFIIILNFILQSRSHEPNFIAIIILSIIITCMLYIIRHQIGINENQFMLSMIDHHNKSLTMANKILPKIKDKRIKILVNHMIKTQYEEIKIMKKILNEQR